MKTIEVCPLLDISGDRYEVDLFSEGVEAIRIQRAELFDNPELGPNDTLVTDTYFRAVIRQKNGAWITFVGMRVLRPKIIKRVVEIISDISGVNYHLNPDGRPGDEPPFEKGERDDSNSTGS